MTTVFQLGVYIKKCSAPGKPKVTAQIPLLYLISVKNTALKRALI